MQPSTPRAATEPERRKDTPASWAWFALVLTAVTAVFAYLNYVNTRWVFFQDPGPFPARDYGQLNWLGVAMFWVIVVMLGSIAFMFWWQTVRLLRERRRAE